MSLPDTTTTDVEETQITFRNRRGFGSGSSSSLAIHSLFEVRLLMTFLRKILALEFQYSKCASYLPLFKKKENPSMVSLQGIGFYLTKNLCKEDEVFEDAGHEEDEESAELAVILAARPVDASTPREGSLDRGRRPATRRSRRTASDGGSPLTGGLPYTGRPLCEYN